MINFIDALKADDAEAMRTSLPETTSFSHHHRGLDNMTPMLFAFSRQRRAAHDLLSRVTLPLMAPFWAFSTLDDSDPNGTTVILLAMKSGYFNWVNPLYTQCFQSKRMGLLTQFDSDNMNSLMYAYSQGHEQVNRWLVPFDPCSLYALWAKQNNQGQNSLHLMAKNQCAFPNDLFAKLNPTQQQSLLHQVDEQGLTPLHVAVAVNNEKFAKEVPNSSRSMTNPVTTRSKLFIDPNHELAQGLDNRSITQVRNALKKGATITSQHVTHPSLLVEPRLIDELQRELAAIPSESRVNLVNSRYSSSKETVFEWTLRNGQTQILSALLVEAKELQPILFDVRHIPSSNQNAQIAEYFHRTLSALDFQYFTRIQGNYYLHQAAGSPTMLCPSHYLQHLLPNVRQTLVASGLGFQDEITGERMGVLVQELSADDCFTMLQIPRLTRIYPLNEWNYPCIIAMYAKLDFNQRLAILKPEMIHELLRAKINVSSIKALFAGFTRDQIQVATGGLNARVSALEIAFDAGQDDVVQWLREMGFYFPPYLQEEADERSRQRAQMRKKLTDASPVSSIAIHAALVSQQQEAIDDVTQKVQQLSAPECNELASHVDSKNVSLLHLALRMNQLPLAAAFMQNLSHQTALERISQRSNASIRVLSSEDWAYSVEAIQLMRRHLHVGDYIRLINRRNRRTSVIFNHPITVVDALTQGLSSQFRYALLCNVDNDGTSQIENLFKVSGDSQPSLRGILGDLNPQQNRDLLDMLPQRSLGEYGMDNVVYFLSKVQPDDIYRWVMSATSDNALQSAYCCRSIALLDAIVGRLNRQQQLVVLATVDLHDNENNGDDELADFMNRFNHYQQPALEATNPQPLANDDNLNDTPRSPLLTRRKLGNG